LPQACNDTLFYSDIHKATAALGVQVGAPHYADELGYVALKTAPKNTHIDTYKSGPTYKTLLESSDTAYPPVSEPLKVQTIAIDTNGDGVDELAYVARNSVNGLAHIDVYSGAPGYKTLISNSDTAYPGFDPQKSQVVAIDTNGDGVDELGFVARNQTTGKAHIDVYKNAPAYNVLLSDSDTAYPSFTDLEKLQALAIDTDGDGVDELGFLALQTPWGQAHLDVYKNGPAYNVLSSNCDTGYPSIAEPKYVQALAIDTNGDGVDELGFLALKTSSANTHLDIYKGGPCYNVLSSDSDTAYPQLSNVDDIQALALNTSTAAYEPPPPPTPSWHYENLGGQFLGDPDIASAAPGYLNVFARGLDNNLWQKWWAPPGGWTALQNVSALAGGGPIASSPGAVSWGPGRMDAVARMAGSDTPGHYWWDGNWHYENLGGQILGDPDIISAAPGYLNVFVRGLDNNLWQKWFTPGVGWSAYQNVSAIAGGGPMAGSPGAVSWGPNRVDVVARMAGTNSLGHWYYDGSTWHYENLGGQILGDPDIMSEEPGRLNIYVKGLDNNLWQKWISPGGSWSAYENVSALAGGGQLAGGPGAVSWGPGRADVVARMAADSSIGHWGYGY